MSISIESLERQTNIPVLGNLFYWRLGSIMAPDHVVKQLFVQYNFARYLPTPITQQVAMDRAVKLWVQKYKYKQNTTSTSEFKERKFYSKITTPTHIVYVLVRQMITFNDFSLDHGAEFRVILDRKTDKVVVTAGPPQQMPVDPQYIVADKSQELEAYYIDAQHTYVSGDFTVLLRQIAYGELLCVRTGRSDGPPYFTPVEQSERLEQFRDLVASLPTKGKNAHVYAIPQVDMYKVKNELGMGIHEGILDDVEAIENALAEMKAQQENGISQEKLADLITEYTNTADKTRLYATKLDRDMTDALERIESLQDAVRDLLRSAKPRNELRKKTHLAVTVTP